MQKEAIQKTEGPCIILAGAGTGKTHTIVEKIKYLLKNKIYEPERIVCLTFSNEAANSLKERVLPIVNHDEPVIKTFHSFCLDLLKKHGQKINIKENFKILLPDDAIVLLHKNFKIKPHLCKKYISTIGIAKDLGITQEQLEDYLNKKNLPKKAEKLLQNLEFQLQTQFTAKNPSENAEKEKKQVQEKIKNLSQIVQINKFLKSWKAYEKLKKIKNYQDYSDLNKNAISLLKNHPDISENYDYIIIDEFQDTNKLQSDFLKLLAPHKNITVVGDLNQSIYRFRGAYRENVENFKKAFKTTEKDIYALDKSYRSTNKILGIAHKLIKNNYQNKNDCFEVKSVFDKEGEKIKIFELKNNKEEIRKIIEIIKKEIKNKTPLNEICVMFRTHQQSRSLKNELDFYKIPYTSITKKSLLKIQPIKITIDFLTILSKIKAKTKGGEQAWWDLVNSTGYDKEDLIKITKAIKEHRKDDCLSISMLNILSTRELKLSEGGRVKLLFLLKQIKDLIPKSEKTIPELILDIYKINHLQDLEKSTHGKEYLLNLQKFHLISQEYSEVESNNLSDFVHHLEIVNTLGIEIESRKLENSGVRIMTHHSTKGLEYDAIILSSMVQKKFPIEKITKNPYIPPEISPELKDLEKSEIKNFEEHNNLLEERRLCYVAFTRAKERLYITYAKEYSGKKFYPSQFLNEINYKQNIDIKFTIDLDEKYEKPVIEEKLELPIETMSVIFSPSSLQTFDECQKKYEYKYIYNMPEPLPISWEALKLGSFVHLIFEEGVKKNLQTEKEFIDLAKTLQDQERWSFIELEDAMPLIKVFYHRHKEKYNSKSLTEKKLKIKIENINFQGIADRIDLKENGELEIIDYKTGQSDIKPKFRNWQLGFYALAAKSLGKPKFLTLEMLKKENPITFVLDENSNAREIHSKRTSFNLNEVKEEIVSTAKKILDCYDKGFKPCPAEKNCSFCSEYVWN